VEADTRCRARRLAVLVASVAAMSIAAGVAGPAQAENTCGGPPKDASSQCFTGYDGSGDSNHSPGWGGWSYWNGGTCKDTFTGKGTDWNNLGLTGNC
jgi:hypothetical protein